MTDTTGTTQVNTDPQSDDTLPQWARDQISQANAQAAKYRTEKNDAVEAAKAEVEQEWTSKFQQLEEQITGKDTELSAARTEVVKLKAALEAGIDSDKVMTFASLLKGETEDELKSHAEEVKKLFAAPETPAPKNDPAHDPSQGSGNPLPLNGDPLLAAVTKIVGK